LLCLSIKSFFNNFSQALGTNFFAWQEKYWQQKMFQQEENAFK